MSSKFCIEKFQINLSDLKMIKETLSIVMISLEVVFVLFYLKKCSYWINPNNLNNLSLWQLVNFEDEIILS